MIDRQSPIPPATAKVILLQLVNAVNYMHTAGVIHKNICLSNVLLSSSDGDLTGGDLANVIVKLTGFHIRFVISVRDYC